MRRDVLKLLEDVRVAATSIQDYTQGLTEAGYLAGKPIRRAVELEFEIIGFRNILAHGYDAVVDERVWNTVAADIPVLLAAVRALIEEERQLP